MILNSILKNVHKGGYEMADIINFQKYVNAEDEKKKCIRQASILLSKRKDIEVLLHNIDNSIECSIITRHIGEMSQIVGKENLIDPATLDVITNSLKDYKNKICEQINELNRNGNMKNTVISEM